MKLLADTVDSRDVVAGGRGRLTGGVGVTGVLFILYGNERGGGADSVDGLEGVVEYILGEDVCSFRGGELLAFEVGI